jgi:anti-sigma regulatory factor (Ser/Thr protein kinase)
MSSRSVSRPEATVLLTNELISNAVLHARTDMELRLRTWDDGLRVERARRQSRHEPLPTPADATRARGLHLVGARERWGVEGTPDGKVVWFRADFARIG